MPPLPHSRRVALVLSIISISVVVDQATKLLAKATLAGRPPKIFLGDLFRLQYAENPGAILSLGAFLPDAARFWVFVVFVGLVLAGLLVASLGHWRFERSELVAFALIVGGGASNLGDRIWQNGLVTDFLNVGVGRLRTGIFNVADMAIMAGALILVWYAFTGRRRSSD